MIDLSERPMNPEIGNCDLFSDARRKTCYERGTISITYSNRLSIFPLQTDSNRYPCEFAFPIRRWRKDARSPKLLYLHRYRGNKVCRVLCTCSGWFKHIEPPRTFSNHIITKIARCVEFCHISSGWFDCTEPSLSTSLQR